MLIIFGATAGLVTGTLLPLLFAAVHAELLAAHRGETQGGFGSLAGVAILFSNQWLLLAG